ncbi:MAG: YihY/virulence factor BrkB family protein [Thermoanaerobaculia bacterium]
MRSSLRFLRELQHRVIRHALGAESARLAYFAFLALFPAILVLFALTGLLGGQAAFDWIMFQLEAALPEVAAAYVGQFVLEVTGSFRPGALSFGIVLMIWTSSHIFAVLAHALNVIFGLKENRRWRRRRGVALLFQVVGMLAIVAAATAVLAGPTLIQKLGIDAPWTSLRWPAIAVTVVGAIWILYTFLPNWDSERSKRRILVGALIGAALWAGTTEAFRLYVANVGRYSRVYGFVGAVIILQLWLYLSALTVLIGAEIAAMARGWGAPHPPTRGGRGQGSGISDRHEPSRRDR